MHGLSVLRMKAILPLTLACSTAFAVPAAPVQPLIQLDQFGYLPDSVKIAVLAAPQTGYDAALAYAPGTTLEVRNWQTDAVVFSGAPTAWNGGATHAQSGNMVKWLDFSSLTAWGSFYIYDPTNNVRSYPFEIRNDVYRIPLRHAARVFFYQRSGFAKNTPFADAKWTDGASHLGSNQDLNCRLVTDPYNASLSKNLSGGWFDAGDYNKYVNFTHDTLHDLLFAYQHNPAIWTDDSGIPESGNGKPDLLDEIQWELEWLKRMQQADGSVLSKVSVTGFDAASPPGSDTAARRYGAASTSSTLTVASVFAHAARVYAGAGQTSEAADLHARAVLAWNWADANPSVIYNNAGFLSADPETSGYGRTSLKFSAAIYLYTLTFSSTYKAYVEGNYTSIEPYQWGYFFPFQSAVQDALMEYTAFIGPTPSVVSAIRNAKQSGMGGGEFLPAYNNKTDAYRAYLKDSDYVWGSNSVKSHMGLIFQAQLTYGLDPANAAKYRGAAEGFLHYIHGTNPQGMVYLTNMNSHGAGRSANEMYHAWFGDGTVYDNAATSPNGPPPGYVTGGANPTFAPDGSYGGQISPPQNQPVQKSYKDWNTSYPQNSWSVTEPAIYYQAAYLRLLSSYTRPLTYPAWAAGHSVTGGAQGDPDADGITNLQEYAVGTDPNVASSTSLAALSLDASSGTLGWRLARGRADLTTQVLTSTTMEADWQTLGPATSSGLPTNDFVTAVLSNPAADPARFYRLKFSTIDPPADER